MKRKNSQSSEQNEKRHRHADSSTDAAETSAMETADASEPEVAEAASEPEVAEAAPKSSQPMEVAEAAPKSAKEIPPLDRQILGPYGCGLPAAVRAGWQWPFIEIVTHRSEERYKGDWDSPGMTVRRSFRYETDGSVVRCCADNGGWYSDYLVTAEHCVAAIGLNCFQLWKSIYVVRESLPMINEGILQIIYWYWW